MELPLRLQDNKDFSKGTKISVYYHSVFSFPLKKEEIKRWIPGKKAAFSRKVSGKVVLQSGFYFLTGQKENVYKRALNEKISREKIKIAKKAVNILKKIPSIKMIGITGSLAMINAKEESDIDLMFIVTQGTLWTTRLLSYFLLFVSGVRIRRPNDKNEKDKLCLNIWIDEKSVEWKRKNIFTAHEILQVMPLFDRGEVYKSFVDANSWVFDYWPMAYRKTSGKMTKIGIAGKILIFLIKIVEPLAFWLQYTNMRERITKETVTPSKALFHPVDWSKTIKSSGF